MNNNTIENKAESVATQEKTEKIAVKEEINNPTIVKEETPAEDPNWKAFREGRKKDRLEREAAEAKAREKEAEVLALKAAMEAAFTNQPIQRQQSQNNDYNNEEEETEDQKIERKVQQALEIREKQAQKQREEYEKQSYPQRLVQTYSDFNSAIAQENLDYLEYHYPEVAQPLQHLPDGFDKWSYIYKAIKKFVPNHSTSNKEAKKAENNFNKPKSMSTTSITQPGNTSGSHIIPEDRKAQNWARMKARMNAIE